MANIVITAAGTNYLVVSNDVDTGWTRDYIHPNDIDNVHVNGCVSVHFNGVRFPWELTLDGADGTWKIDTVNATTPADLDELAALMIGLKG